MEISEEVVLEIWETFMEHLPASKRNDLAMRYLKIFLDQDIDVSDLEDIRGEDEHIDHALDQFADDDRPYDDEESEYED
jgi:hypothetical protein